MEYIILALFSMPFLFLNYKIVISDIKEKKIPNKLLKYLIFLIPIWYIYLLGFGYINLGDIFSIFLQLTLSFFVSFGLYSLGIWSAGDAKYLLILSLFIPYIGIVNIIGNLALITLSYLILYFFYFYLVKCLFDINYSKNLFLNIKNSFSDKFKIFKSNNGGDDSKYLLILGIIKTIVAFMIIFTIIRLTRTELIQYISLSEHGEYFDSIIKKYSVYLVAIVIGIILGVGYLIRLISVKLRLYLSKREKTSKYSGLILYLILFAFLFGYIVAEYNKNPEIILSQLKLIFSLYIGLYILARIMIFSYKLTFSIGEEMYIDYKKLEPGMVVDKMYLVKLLGEQQSLGANGNKEGILYPSPKKAFLQMDKNLNNDNIKWLKKIIGISNKLKPKNHDIVSHIKIVSTFSFGPYIFLGFIFTYIFEDKIFELFLSGIKYVITSHFLS